MHVSNMPSVVPCAQEYGTEGSRHSIPRVQVSSCQSVPARALWRALGGPRKLPWDVTLRLELDGALDAQGQQAVLRAKGRATCRLHCPKAVFNRVEGNQLVAWRFMPPNTLVYAVRTTGAEPGCGTAVAEQEQG